MPSLHIDKHIVLDQIQTWPQNILDLIQRNEIYLKEFLSYEKKKRQEKDFKKRIKLSPNKNKELWDSTLNEISEELKGQNIVGIHCTKLMDYEITEVQEVGLLPLNKEHAIKRVEKLYRKGFISKKLKDEITNKSELEDSNRVGAVYVFHDTKTLKNEYGLRKLFCFWGGEAIFQYLKNPKPLFFLGIPCIVVVSINSNDIDLSCFAETMLCIYFKNGYKRLSMESAIDRKLKVLEVIQRDSKLFNTLTDFDSWDLDFDTI
jgi:hypothetical protein